MPIERSIQAGITVRLIGYTKFILQAFLQGASLQIFFIVTRIHAAISTSHTEPVRIAVTCRHIKTFRLYTPVIIIGTITFTTKRADGTDDVIFCITINQTSFHIELMLAQAVRITEIQVDIVTVLRIQVSLTRFQVLITEQLFIRWQPISFLIRELYL